jgi:streptogramin lyase
MFRQPRSACKLRPFLETLEDRLLPSINIVDFTVATPGTGITAGFDGNVWFTESAANKIAKVNPHSHALSEFALPTPNSGPYGITSGPDGNLWFTEYNANRIGEINPSTNAISEFNIPTANAGYPAAIAITAGPDGNLWFSGGRQIGNMNPRTHAISEFSVSTGLINAIAAGPDGNVWFPEYDKIAEINPRTGAISEFAVPTANSYAWGITSGPDGNLWFTEYYGNKIGEINPSTHVISEFSIPPIDGGGGTFHSKLPQGITTGPDGNPWFTESAVASSVPPFLPAQPGNLGQINPTTHTITELPIPSLGSAPSAMTAGPEGNVWFTESQNKIGVVMFVSPQAASQLVVTTAADLSGGHTGSLRDAVAQANCDAEAGQSDTITFDPRLAGATIKLTQGQLELSGSGGSIAIDGSNLSAHITLSGNNASRVFLVDGGVQAVIKGLTIQDGKVLPAPATVPPSMDKTLGPGAGIENDGTLTLSGDTITNNSAGDSTTYDTGGGVYNSGALTVSNSTISSNFASAGGGIENGDLDRSGAIVPAGRLTISHSTISFNTASSGAGGGIDNTGTLLVQNTIASGNSASGYGTGNGGGIANRGGTLTVSSSTFSSNTAYAGGGIYSGPGAATVATSTFSFNSAAGAGVAGVGTVVNCTFFHNYSAPPQRIGSFNIGGYSAIAGASAITDVTAYGNTGGPAIGGFGGILYNSIVAGNTGGDIAPGSTYTGSNNVIGGNPLLAPLGNYGGPSQTMALLPGSPAIAAGTAAVSTLTIDISPTATTLTVTNPAILASTPGQYFIRIDTEVMEVTNVSLANNSLTVIRGVQATAATVHSANTPVYYPLTDQRGYVRPYPPSIGAYEYNGTPRQLPTPTLISPGGSITNVLPNFTWNPVAGADYYELWVGDVQTSPLVINQISATSFTATTPLVPGHTYTWYVQAFSNDGALSPWSAGMSLTIQLLAVPGLSGPSGSTALLAPAVQWTAVSGADSYDVWLSDVTTGQYVQQRTTTNSFIPANPLVLGHSYKCWVRAQNNSGDVSPWSSALAFAVVLASPIPAGPGGSLQNASPTFTWNAVANADWYDIWVSDVTTGQVIRNSQVSGTSWTPTMALSPADRYEWWVRSLSSSGVASSWSSGISFTVTLLSTPTLTSPSGSIQTVTPTFTWNAVGGADSYELWLADVSARVSPLLDAGQISNTTFTPSNPLAQGHTYLWYVRAHSNNGDVSAWSEAMSFTVPLLGVPTLTGPIGPMTTTTPTFTWNPIMASSSYELWLVDLNTAQILDVPSITTTSFTPTAPLILGHCYQWWVKGQFWGISTMFSIIVAAPTPLSPSGPIQTATPTFTWTAAANADYYDVWVSDLTTGVSPVVRNSHATATSWTPGAALKPGDSYQWWVRGLSASGVSSAWSGGATFSVTSFGKLTIS